MNIVEVKQREHEEVAALILDIHLCWGRIDAANGLVHTAFSAGAVEYEGCWGHPN